MPTKKNYEPELKAKAAIEAIKNCKTTTEICAEFKIPSTSLYDWRDKVLSNAKNIFIPENEFVKQQRLLKQEISDLHKILGEITVENNYLKKKLSI
jgi:transposase